MPTHKLEDQQPFSAVRVCLLHIFTATLNLKIYLIFLSSLEFANVRLFEATEAHSRFDPIRTAYRCQATHEWEMICYETNKS
jgi:hypothetical protein